MDRLSRVSPYKADTDRDLKNATNAL
jgi:hypothetical protein